MSKTPSTQVATNNDNRYFQLKVSMRLKSLPDKPVKVLECFAGEGKIWKKVKEHANHEIQITALDINYYPNSNNIICDSLKYLKQRDLSKYHVIDLDSWGSPITHLDVIFKKQYKGIVHCTYGNPININPQKKLSEVYFAMPKGTIKKKPSLFAKNLESQIKNYLAINGVKKVTGLFISKRNYFWFIIS